VFRTRKSSFIERLCIELRLFEFGDHFYDGSSGFRLHHRFKGKVWHYTSADTVKRAQNTLVRVLWMRGNNSRFDLHHTNLLHARPLLHIVGNANVTVFSLVRPISLLDHAKVNSIREIHHVLHCPGDVQLSFDHTIFRTPVFNFLSACSSIHPSQSLFILSGEHVESLVRSQIEFYSTSDSFVVPIRFHKNSACRVIDNLFPSISLLSDTSQLLDPVHAVGYIYHSLVLHLQVSSLTVHLFPLSDHCVLEVSKISQR